MTEERLTMAREALGAGRYQEVFDLLGVEQESEKLPPVGLYLLAVALFRSQKYVDSLKCWEHLERLQLSPKSKNTVRINLWNTAYMAARDEAQKGHFAESARYLQRFCQGNPGFREDELFRKVTTLSCLAATVTEIDEAQRLAESGNWVEAAQRLIVARSGLNSGNSEKGGAKPA